MNFVFFSCTGALFFFGCIWFFFVALWVKKLSEARINLQVKELFDRMFWIGMKKQIFGKRYDMKI